MKEDSSEDYITLHDNGIDMILINISFLNL